MATPMLRPTRSGIPSISISWATAACSRGERLARGLQRRLGRNQVEFVAPETREECGAGRVAQPGRKPPQQGISDPMPEHVVDVLEAIEIDAEQRELLARNLRLLQRRSEAIVERRPVGQLGQAVMTRQARDLRFGPLLL